MKNSPRESISCQETCLLDFNFLVSHKGVVQNEEGLYNRFVGIFSWLYVAWPGVHLIMRACGDGFLQRNSLGNPRNSIRSRQTMTLHS